MLNFRKIENQIKIIEQDMQETISVFKNSIDELKEELNALKLEYNEENKQVDGNIRQYLLEYDKSKIAEEIYEPSDENSRLNEFYEVVKRKVKKEAVVFVSCNTSYSYTGNEHRMYGYYTEDAFYMCDCYVDGANELELTTTIKYKDIIDMETYIKEYSRTEDTYLIVNCMNDESYRINWRGNPKGAYVFLMDVLEQIN